jgi:hypothetical protein
MSARTNAPAFQSIFELGRVAGAISRKVSDYGDEPGGTERESLVGSRLCFTLLEHLQGIIAGRRAETLADVTAQLVAAFSIVEDIDNENLSQEEVSHGAAALRRIVLGALPVVAAAAGVDLAELDAEQFIGLGDRDFPPVMAAPDGGGKAGFGETQP